MLADPVPDGAVRQAGVSLLVAGGEVSDLGYVGLLTPQTRFKSVKFL